MTFSTSPKKSFLNAGRVIIADFIVLKVSVLSETETNLFIIPVPTLVPIRVSKFVMSFNPCVFASK